MNDWIYISIVFGALALMAMMYEPKMLVENDDGIVTYEDAEEGRPTILERLRVIFALAIAWAIVLAIDYHEVVLKTIQDFMNL